MLTLMAGIGDVGGTRSLSQHGLTGYLTSSFPLTHPCTEFIFCDWAGKFWLTCLPASADKGVCTTSNAALQSTAWRGRVWPWWETSFYNIYVPLPDVCLKLPPDTGKTGGKSVITPHHLFCSQPCLLFLFTCPLMHSYLFACFTHCLSCPLGPNSDRHLCMSLQKMLFKKKA